MGKFDQKPVKTTKDQQNGWIITPVSSPNPELQFRLWKYCCWVICPETIWKQAAHSRDKIKIYTDSSHLQWNPGWRICGRSSPGILRPLKPPKSSVKGFLNTCNCHWLTKCCIPAIPLWLAGLCALVTKAPPSLNSGARKGGRGWDQAIFTNTP